MAATLSVDFFISAQCGFLVNMFRIATLGCNPSMPRGWHKPLALALHCPLLTFGPGRANTGSCFNPTALAEAGSALILLQPSLAGVRMIQGGPTQGGTGGLVGEAGEGCMGICPCYIAGTDRSSP